METRGGGRWSPRYPENRSKLLIMSGIPLSYGVESLRGAGVSTESAKNRFVPLADDFLAAPFSNLTAAVPTTGDMQGTGHLVSSWRRYDLDLFSCIVCQRGRIKIPAFLLYRTIDGPELPAFRLKPNGAVPI